MTVSVPAFFLNKENKKGVNQQENKEKPKGHPDPVYFSS